MMYSYKTLEDGTEIIRSDIEIIDGKECIRVYIEKPIPLGFHSVWCILPDYQWTDNQGFSDSELADFKQLLSMHLALDKTIFV